MVNYKINYRALIILLISLIFFTYRDFLENLKLHIFYFYNEKMLPIDPYYKIILFYDGIITERLGVPWELRLFPNIINFVFYKIFPCLKINQIPSFISNNEYCSIWAITFVNYLFSILTSILFFFYLKIKLNRNNFECALGLFTSYLVINFLNKYGIDKVSIFFCLLFFYIDENKIQKIIFIFLSIFVNEKIIILIITYYVAKILDEVKLKNLFKINKNKYFFELFFSGLSFLLYLIILFNFFTTLNDNNNGMIDAINSYFFNLFSMHFLSNTLIPTLLMILPAFIFINNKEIKQKFKINNYFFIIYIIFIILGLIAGGAGNAGRYMIFILPITLPLINYLICKIANSIVKKIY